jgi:branched-chain amino acid transport system permease protein
MIGNSLGNFVGVLFDGIAYGSLLFLISVGLSVTMGMMNFINLAHGAFAMIGGYVCVTLLSRLGLPFLATLPLAFLAAAVVGLVLERTLYRRLYKASHLDQVLFSIGLTFMAVAGATWLFGPTQQPVNLPDWLRGQVHVLGLDLGVYRLFLIGVVVLVTTALVLLIERTRFGAQIRASVDNQTAAAGLGINVSRVFSLTFALGSGLAGLGGGLGIDVLGLDPSFPVKYMVYFLLVVAVGGAGSIKGPLIAALILGVFDVAGKYYVPEVGAFVIYTLMVVLLILFPFGLVRRKA